MQNRMRVLTAGLVLALALPAAARAATLQVGAKAPNFTLPDQQGKPVSLSQFVGKKNVVLAFYVLAFTKG